MNPISPLISGTIPQSAHHLHQDSGKAAPQEPSIAVKATLASARNNTGEEQRRLRELRERDREVRAREAAIRSAASFAHGAAYTYERGPDGRLYAVRGASSIQLETEGQPLQELQQAETVRLLALTQPSHSFRDLAIATHALRTASEMRIAMLEDGESPTPDSGSSRKAAVAVAARGAEAYSGSVMAGTPTTPALLNLSA